MKDVHTKEIRSFNMSRIRGKDTKPELQVRKYLFSKGIRYRLHDKNLPGKPDLVFPKYKMIIFIHGCFWHGHEECKYSTIPKTRTKWWMDKIQRNKSNDNKNALLLEKLGYEVVEVWECELKAGKRQATFGRLLSEFS